jgi:predicted PurR-regulated permease PerM
MGSEIMANQSPSQPYLWTFRKVVWATLVLVSIVFGFWLIYRFYLSIFLLFVAIMIGTVIRPIVTWLEKHGLRRKTGILFVFLLLFSALIGFMFLLLPLIVNQSATIAASIPGYYQSLRLWAFGSPNQLILQFSQFLPGTLPGLTPTQQTGQEVLASAEQVLSYVSLGAYFLFIATAVLLLIYRWTLDGPQYIHAMLQFIPKIQHGNIGELISAMETKVGFFILGQIVLCLAIGIMALITYLIIGLPNALVLALVAGVMEAIPMLGPVLGAIPAAVIALSISPLKLIWVVIGTLVIQQLENNLLVPRIMRKAVGVNPFVSLLAIFAFSSLFGIAGALMAIPFAAIIQLLLDRFVFHPVEIEPVVPAGRDLASRLRYEAKALVEDLRKQARVNKEGSDLNLKQIDQVMDEIETITADLDTLLEHFQSAGDE